jgi:hypothetical protein
MTWRATSGRPYSEVATGAVMSRIFQGRVSGKGKDGAGAALDEEEGGGRRRAEEDEAAAAAERASHSKAKGTTPNWIVSVAAAAERPHLVFTVGRCRLTLSSLC